MKLISIWTALMLLLPANAAGSQAAVGTPQVTGSKQERAAAAAAYYAQGDFVRAALGFEGLRGDYPQERDYLFNAAASRHGAGHYAHAVAYTREYLALAALPAADRQEAEAQLKEAESNVGSVTVTVTVEPGAQEPWTLLARHVARESGDIRPDLPISASAGTPIKLALDPGTWTLHAQGSGYVAAEQRVEVARSGSPAISLQLTRAPVAEAPDGNGDTVAPPRSTDVSPQVVRRTALGFGIGGGVVAVAGIAVLGVGASGIKNAADCDESDPGRCVADLRNGLLLRDLGAVGLGSGVGLLVGGLTWKLRDARARRTAWIAEAALGGVASVVGMVLMTVTFKSFNAANDVSKISAWDPHYQDYKQSAGHAASSAVFGLGVGTLVSAGASLGLQRRHLGKHVQVSGMTGRGQFGLALTGRF